VLKDVLTNRGAVDLRAVVTLKIANEELAVVGVDGTVTARYGRVGDTEVVCVIAPDRQLALGEFDDSPEQRPGHADERRHAVLLWGESSIFRASDASAGRSHYPIG
jgi:hypothetical protein